MRDISGCQGETANWTGTELILLSCHAYQFQAMQNYAINNHLTPFISMQVSLPMRLRLLQNFHHAAYREEERDDADITQMFGVGCIP